MRYASLDGLRGLAAYTVVIAHFGNFIGSGWSKGAGQIGVMLFFTLSGFLMARLYMTKPIDWKAVGNFWQKRAARVMPLYLLLVITSYALTSSRGSPFPLFKITDDNLGEHLLFWKGWSILWTIPVEVQFYAIFPLIWWIYSRIEKAVVLWLLLGIATIVALNFPPIPPFLPFAPFFLAGVMAALFPVQRRVGSDVLFIVCCIAFVLILPQVSGRIGLESGTLWRTPLHLIFVTVFLLATLNSPLAEKVLGNSATRFLGAISYSVYLLHIPLLSIVAWLRLGSLHPLLFLISFLTVVTVVAWGSFIIIENPLRRYFSPGVSHASSAVNPAT